MNPESTFTPIEPPETNYLPSQPIPTAPAPSVSNVLILATPGIAEKKVSSISDKVERAKKTFFILGLISGISLALLVVLSVIGLSSQDAVFVQTVESVVGIGSVPVGIAAGLWFAQLCRIAINVRDEGLFNIDQRTQVRKTGFRLFVAGLVVFIALSLSGILGNFITDSFQKSSISTGSSIAILSGAIALGLLSSFVLVIVGLILTWANRVKPQTLSTPSLKRLHWVLRWLLMACGFIFGATPVLAVMLFLYIQLYSHWCNLTSSKCY